MNNSKQNIKNHGAEALLLMAKKQLENGDVTKAEVTLNNIITSAGNVYLETSKDPFVTLFNSILGQQISVAAAESIKKRIISKYKITEDDIPKWKDNINSQWGFNVIPDRQGRIPLNLSLKVTVQVRSMEKDEIANNFNNSISIESSSEYLLLHSVSGLITK